MVRTALPAEQGNPQHADINPQTPFCLTTQAQHQTVPSQTASARAKGTHVPPKLYTTKQEQTSNKNFTGYLSSERCAPHGDTRVLTCQLTQHVHFWVVFSSKAK